MRVLFMGTPEFAVKSLDALALSSHEVVGVVTRAEKPKKRGQKPLPTPVKEYALTRNIPVFEPERIKNGELLPVLEVLKPDVIIVAAYGKILPEEILSYPKYGCVNVHASLLPRLRGAAPINWAIINGDTKTGITIMQMDEGLDTGDILTQAEILISPEENVSELYARLAALGGALLIETLLKIEEGRAVPQKQEESRATYAPMLTKELCEIDFSKSAKEVHNLVRGLSPIPGAHTVLKSEQLKIVRTRTVSLDRSGRAGEVLIASPKEGLFVACGEKGCLEILSLQRGGGKILPAPQFLNGYKILPGELFGREIV